MKGGEIMKMTKKLLALCIFITVLATTLPQGIKACTKKPNCYSTSVSVTCGAVNGYESGQHQVEEPNGYVATCKIQQCMDHIHLIAQHVGLILAQIIEHVRKFIAMFIVIADMVYVSKY